SIASSRRPTPEGTTRSSSGGSRRRGIPTEARSSITTAATAGWPRPAPPAVEPVRDRGTARQSVLVRHQVEERPARTDGGHAGERLPAVARVRRERARAASREGGVVATPDLIDPAPPVPRQVEHPGALADRQIDRWRHDHLSCLSRPAMRLTE